MLIGEPGVLHPLVVSKNWQVLHSLSPQGCNLSQNSEQMAEGKAILTVVHSSNTGHASTAAENSVFK